MRKNIRAASVMQFSFPRIWRLALTTIGVVLVVVSLAWYQVDELGSSLIATRDISSIEVAGYVTLALVIVGLVLASVGATLCIRKIPSGGFPSSLSSGITRLSSVMADRRSGRVFALSAVSYGILFGVISSTLVFQPGAVFSNTYGVNVPSLVPVVCCGSFGQMPQLVVYITQQLALLIVPENLILLFIVSWLVGLNATIASFAYANRSQLPGTRWLGGLGAMIGLFTVCPSCAGFFLLAVLGLGGAVSLTLTLSSLQALFIGVGIPILAVTPVLMTRRIPISNACRIIPESQDST
jgi:hypothetical protein